AFPDDHAAPAQAAAGKRGGKAVHDEPRHGEPPLLQEGERAPVALRAGDVARLRIPVVGELVDEAEAQPYRIAEIDSRNPPPGGGMLEDTVGGEGEGLGGKNLGAPAADLLRWAAPRRRKGGIGILRHTTQRLTRQ